MKATGNIIFDNWSLELARLVLSEYPSGNLSFLDAIPQEGNWKDTPELVAGYGPPIESTQSIPLQMQGISAISKFVEAIVLFDCIYYADLHSSVWTHSAYAFGSSIDYLRPLETDSATNKMFLLEAQAIAQQSSANSGFSSLVRKGALFYLLLGNHLGHSYSPSALRAKFIEEEGLNWPKSLRFGLFEKVDSDIYNICEEFRKEYGTYSVETVIPSIANHVFNNCESKSSVISTAIEIRESSGGVALRNWLRRIEYHMGDGNLVAFKKELVGLKEIVSAFQKAFKADDYFSTRLRLGFSPSIEVSLRLPITRIFHGKKLHLTFLQKIIRDSFGARRYWESMERLFGYSETHDPKTQTISQKARLDL